MTRDVAKAADETALIAKYNAIAAPLANRVIGSITADITRTNNAAGESALGDVIADAQLEATKAPGFGDAVVAFMNPGGIRADLTYASSAAARATARSPTARSFTVQPFGNSLVTMTLTGAQIERVLEEQFAGCTLRRPPASCRSQRASPTRGLRPDPCATRWTRRRSRSTA